VHICIPNHFCNQCFFSFHIKNTFPIFQVPGGVETGAFFVKGPPRTVCKTSPI
jgi:hypothetical protein